MHIGYRQLWSTALGKWDQITAPDLHQVYGLDDADPAFWARSWRSLQGRIRGLLDVPSTRLHAALVKP